MTQRVCMYVYVCVYVYVYVMCNMYVYVYMYMYGMCVYPLPPSGLVLRGPCQP
jgi:hypothetical protein